MEAESSFANNIVIDCCERVEVQFLMMQCDAAVTKRVTDSVTPTTICMALKRDTCIFPHRLHGNHSFKSCDTCLFVVSKVSLFVRVLDRDC